MSLGKRELGVKKKWSPVVDPGTSEGNVKAGFSPLNFEKLPAEYFNGNKIGSDLV
jgi:hypothetical protein